MGSLLEASFACAPMAIVSSLAVYGKPFSDDALHPTTLWIRTDQSIACFHQSSISTYEERSSWILYHGAVSAVGR